MLWWIMIYMNTLSTHIFIGMENQSLTSQYLVPMQQKRLDRLCCQAEPTQQLEAIYDEPDQIPIPIL